MLLERPESIGELSELLAAPRSSSTDRLVLGVHEQLPEGTVAEPYLSIDRMSVGERAERSWVIRCPYEAAVALADGDDEAGLRRAYDELQALGARPAAAIVVRRLRDRGARGMPRQRLVVSEKTVAHHVSVILRKLGVQTRRGGSCGGCSARGGRFKIGISAPNMGGPPDA